MKKLNLDYSKSLEHLESEEWEQPDFESSLIKKVLAIRKKPIQNLTIEDLRLMIGQQFSLDYLVPRALQILEVNPFEEGDFYPGDLLVNVLSIKNEFWKTKPELYQQFKQIVEKAKQQFLNFDDEESKKLINNAVQKFENK